MPNDLQTRLKAVSARVNSLRHAVRLDNFRRAQHLRMGLAAYLRHLEDPLRDDVARLFEISGLWLRNLGDCHQTKRQIQELIRHLIPRLRARSRASVEVCQQLEGRPRSCDAD